MSAMAFQITCLTIVYSTVYSGANKRKLQISAALAFVRGIHRLSVQSPHKAPVTQKMSPFDDVIMFKGYTGEITPWSVHFFQFINLNNTYQILIIPGPSYQVDFRIWARSETYESCVTHTCIAKRPFANCNGSTNITSRHNSMGCFQQRCWVCSLHSTKIYEKWTECNCWSVVEHVIAATPIVDTAMLLYDYYARPVFGAEEIVQSKGYLCQWCCSDSCAIFSEFYEHQLDWESLRAGSLPVRWRQGVCNRKSTQPASAISWSHSKPTLRDYY